MRKINEFNADEYLFFILGLLTAAIFALPFNTELSLFPVLFAAFVWNFVCSWKGEKWNWKRFVNILIGGLPIQLLSMV